MNYKEKIIALLNSQELSKEQKEKLEGIFPELKESEDERIRKELIEHIKDQQSSFISPPDCRDKYEEEENNKYNSWIAWLEKQGEQILANSVKTCKDEQKPAWSGGDEAHLHSLITHLEQWIERHPNTTGADIQGENIAWLKFLRPQNRWKPSGEQIEAIKDAIEFLGCTKKVREDLKSLYKQLKKLREE